MRERGERENVSYILKLYTSHYKIKTKHGTLFCFYLVNNLIIISHHSVICFEEIFLLIYCLCLLRNHLNVSKLKTI